MCVYVNIYVDIYIYINIQQSPDSRNMLSHSRIKCQCRSCHESARKLQSYETTRRAPRRPKLFTTFVLHLCNRGSK